MHNAIALVRNSQDVARAVEPYAKEIDWFAEHHDDKWWVIGLFASPWGVRFVQDATIWEGRVYAHVEYGMRPPQEWVDSKAHEQWGLATYYTRLTPELAIEQVKKSEAVSYALRDVEVVDAVAELVEDNAATQQWRFAFYAQLQDGSRAVLAVGGLGTVGACEGDYNSGYGFGNTATAYWDIPLNFADWVSEVANRRGWAEATNVK
jgi:hypothetical protein